MIRSWLRQCKRSLLRHLGFYDLYGQNAALEAQNETVRQLLESEIAASRARSTAAQHEVLAAINRLIASNDLLTRLIETETAGLGNRLQGLAASQAEVFSILKGWNLDQWKIMEYEGLMRYFRRKDYLQAIRDGLLPVPRLETEFPIAIASNDTKAPRGCKNDNSISPRFNRKLYQLFKDRTRLRVLDLGCAGGGLVRSLIDDGHFALGLEGSDYPLLNQSFEWSTIPHHLFTCDITKPFRLFDSATNEPLQFDVITAWEVMEHIAEDDLGGLMENLDRHLAPEGVLLFSIATFLDWDEQSGTIWHVTVKSREWWIDRFARHGFTIEEQHPFGKDDWLRGSGQCRGDWHETQDLGFHVVLRRASIGEPYDGARTRGWWLSMRPERQMVGEHE